MTEPKKYYEPTGTAVDEVEPPPEEPTGAPCPPDDPEPTDKIVVEF